MGLLDKFISEIKKAFPPPNNNKTICDFSNFSLPAPLPSYKDIAEQGHQDPILLLYVIFRRSTFTSKDLEEYREMLGGVKPAIDQLIKLKWISELSPHKVIKNDYTVEELKVFLQTHDLKVSGTKDELVDRLLSNVPYEKFRKKRAPRKYEITSAGIDEISKKREMEFAAYHFAIKAISEGKYLDAKAELDKFDSQYGFSRPNGKVHTFFVVMRFLQNASNISLTTEWQNLKIQKNLNVI